MMALVWIIDVVVQFIKILGGRQPAPWPLRLLVWAAFAGLLVIGITIAVLLVALLDHALATIPPTE